MKEYRCVYVYVCVFVFVCEFTNVHTFSYVHIWKIQPYSAIFSRNRNRKLNRKLFGIHLKDMFLSIASPDTILL